jgi:hypothetical protein
VSREKLLADLVLDTLVWFELVDDATLHPDAAVNMLEEYTWRLGTLDAQGRSWLIDRIDAKYEAESRPRARNALEALKEALLDADAHGVSA